MADIFGISAPTATESPVLARNASLEYQHSVSGTHSPRSTRSSSLASTASDDSFRGRIRGGDSFGSSSSSSSSRKSKTWLRKVGAFFKESLEAAGTSSREAMESGAAYPHPGFKLP